MALPTFLSLVNDVLIRMREPSVSTVNENTVSQLVGKFVNDAKREAADAYDWDAFNTAITVSTVANQYEGYSITGAGVRCKIMDVINTSKQYPLDPMDHASLDLQAYGTANPQKTTPFYYIFGGVDSSGDAQVKFWPIPDAVYNIRFSLIVPENDMVNDSDTTKLPKEPIVLNALARALVERGEDGGLSSSEAYALAKKSLGDLIALELARSPENDAWVPT
jgi:hypothetical protein